MIEAGREAQLVGEGPPSTNGGGLYLRTQDDRVFRLIGRNMSHVSPADYLHRASRHRFEPHLGKRVRVVGHAMFWTIWCAEILDAT